MADICAGCGAKIEGGLEGCQNLFATLLAREYTDFAYAKMNSFTVDAHALQHPEVHGVKNIAHLIRLCWLIEHNGNPHIGMHGPPWFVKHLDGDYRPPPLEIPKNRGAITVVEVAQAQTSEAYEKLARAWGRSAWDAFALHHHWARSELRQILGDGL